MQWRILLGHDNDRLDERRRNSNGAHPGADSGAQGSRNRRQTQNPIHKQGSTQGASRYRQSLTYGQAARRKYVQGWNCECKAVHGIAKRDTSRSSSDFVGHLCRSSLRDGRIRSRHVTGLYGSTSRETAQQHDIGIEVLSRDITAPQLLSPGVA